MLLAVAVMLATPEASVTAGGGGGRIAVAPLVGALKVMMAPLTGLPSESVSVACNAFGNAVLINADCGVPPVAVSVRLAPRRRDLPVRISVLPSPLKSPTTMKKGES